MKIVLALLAGVLFLATSAQAQQSYPRVYNQAELDALLAPIALHPDGLLSQILIAATYPEEVGVAARWSRANPHLKGDDALRAVQGEPWDPSVKALVAFPELLARMDESPQWLHDLGEAFLLQEPHVMDTVQGLRQRAQAAGQLASTEQLAVYQQGEAIVVQPRTQIIYVRYYDPHVVYGPWWWPHYRPVFWRPWAPHPVFVAHGFFFSKPDWHHRHVRVLHRPVHVHRHHHTHVVPGKWQHRKHVVVKPHVRVPEAQRQPIVRQHMPAASGFSHQRRDIVREPRREHRTEPRREVRQEANQRREHRSEPRREHRQENRRETNRQHRKHVVVKPHVRVPEAQRQPIVRSAPAVSPLRSPAVRDAPRKEMPATSGFSQQRKDKIREHRSEPRREHRQQNRRETNQERRGHRG
jgi:hypothetical protein